MDASLRLCHRSMVPITDIMQNDVTYRDTQTNSSKAIEFSGTMGHGNMNYIK